VPAIYKTNICTIIPEYNIGRPTPAANVLNFQGVGAPWTTAQLTAVQSAFDAAWVSHWTTWATANDTYIGSNVIDNSSALGGQVTNATYTPAGGNVVGNPVSDQVCALISLKEAPRYKGGHARIYLPGTALSHTQPDGQHLTGAALTLMDQWWDGVVAAMGSIPTTNGGPFTPVVWHKHWAAFPNTVQPVIGRTAQIVLATQRRRIRKVSRHKKKTPAA
jgi:hypothetical protein